MHSCIYEGLVTHSRFQPLRHRFQYRLYMLYLDLDELPGLVGPGRLISDRRFAHRSFLAADHLSGDRSLAAQLRQWIGEQSGQLPTGKIRLLTQLRYFGYYFSPLNLFYVFDSADQQVECVVAEVNNTPWGERHCYLLWQGNRTDDNRLRFSHRKQLHVSPSWAWICSTIGDSGRRASG